MGIDWPVWNQIPFLKWHGLPTSPIGDIRGGYRPAYVTPPWFYVIHWKRPRGLGYSAESALVPATKKQLISLLISAQSSGFNPKAVSGHYHQLPFDIYQSAHLSPPASSFYA